mmetsp:Transcript_16480/g.51608  ORF Transcript_16480/g.51608 Transcript_16480/m.51608 type:complete len:83 (+) Transcript_16480:36-284(+)
MSGRRVCKVCLESFDPSNADEVCRFHPGSWAGFEKGKLHGTSTTDPGIGHLATIVFQWDCCGDSSRTSAGCVVGRHASYDES